MSFEAWVELEGVLPLGAVIGKDGSNLKWLRRQSGRVAIDVKDSYVSIMGSDKAAVSRCAELLRAQVEANKRLGSLVYPHPLRTDYVLLKKAFGADPRVAFQYRADEAARAARRDKKLFVLCRSESGTDGAGPSAAGDAVDELAAQLMSRVTLRPLAEVSSGRAASASPAVAATQGSRFHVLSSIVTGGAAAAALSESAHKAAAGVTPPFDVLKIRFNIGKQFFYNLNALENAAGLTLQSLEVMDTGARSSLRSTFSNCMPAATVPRVVSWLERLPDFSLVDTKTTATLHVNDEALNVHYAIALTLPNGAHDDRSVTLRKVKSSPTKCHFVALLGGPQQLDLRVKLLGQRRDLKDAKSQSLADNIVDGCRARGYTALVRVGCRGALPPGTTLDVARKKTKAVYEGRFQTASGGDLLVRLSILTVEDKDGVRTEITGSVPELDEPLSELLLLQQRRQGGQGPSSPSGTATTSTTLSPSKGKGTSPSSPSSPSGPQSLCSPAWAADALCGLEELLGSLNELL